MPRRRSKMARCNQCRRTFCLPPPPLSTTLIARRRRRGWRHKAEPANEAAAQFACSLRRCCRCACYLGGAAHRRVSRRRVDGASTARIKAYNENKKMRTTRLCSAVDSLLHRRASLISASLQKTCSRRPSSSPSLSSARSARRRKAAPAGPATRPAPVAATSPTAATPARSLASARVRSFPSGECFDAHAVCARREPRAQSAGEQIFNSPILDTSCG